MNGTLPEKINDSEKNTNCHIHPKRVLTLNFAVEQLHPSFVTDKTTSKKGMNISL